MADGRPTVTKRRQKRERVLLKATIGADAWECEARLRDLSEKGALLETEFPPEVGSQVWFTRGDTFAEARVAWVDEPRFGIEFEESIGAGDVLRHAGPSLRVSAPKSYRGSPLEDGPGSDFALNPATNVVSIWRTGARRARTIQ
jgi:hypothetical protein